MQDVQANHEVVLAAVRQNGAALQCVFTWLRIPCEDPLVDRGCCCAVPYFIQTVGVLTLNVALFGVAAIVLLRVVVVVVVVWLVGLQMNPCKPHAILSKPPSTNCLLYTSPSPRDRG